MSEPLLASLWLPMLTAYLLGAIPFGLLFSKLLGKKDPRDYGSGNIGATNAMRTGGKTVGVLTLLADMMKGAVPVALALHIAHYAESTVALIALSAFLGHIFPVYLKFQGGKGVATMFGVLIPWLPWLALAAFALWLLVFYTTHYVALASILAALVLPAGGWWLGKDLAVLLVLVVLALLVMVRHHSNIRRLLRHEEPRTGGARADEDYVEPEDPGIAR